jgi:rubrerythrin
VLCRLYLGLPGWSFFLFIHQPSTFFQAGSSHSGSTFFNMRSSVFFALSAPLLALAAPARFYTKRAASDILVFKFADVLEQLESNFYQQALAKFQDADFQAAGYTSSQIPIEQFKSIASDEAAHSTVLQATLKAAGEQPITTCKFNFDSVLKDVTTMAAVARVVENVGVGAYLGGATLLTDPVLLAAAGSILTVEARHQTILNMLSSTGTAIPAAFDVALTPSEVLALAGPFISGCDTGIPANTPLTITNTGTVSPGTLLTFTAPTMNGTVPNDKLFCQMLVGGQPMSIPLPLSQCVVPEGINGPVAIFVTSDGQPLLNDVKDRATSQLIAGPALAFIDTQPQMLGQLLRTGGAVNNSGAGAASTATATISPAQASAIVSSAGSASAPAPTDANGASSPSPASGSGSGVHVNSGSASAAVPAASGSASAAAPAASGAVPVVNGASTAPANGGKPVLTTGKSADGHITVNGWKTT